MQIFENLWVIFDFSRWFILLLLLAGLSQVYLATKLSNQMTEDLKYNE
jgi:hypothetical protein